MNEVDGEDPAEEAYPHRYLDTLREISDAGMHLAVPAAMFYCATNNVPVPEWLTERASQLMNGLLHLHDDRTRKIMREMIKAYRKDQIHYARFDAVLASKEARNGLYSDVEALKRLPGLEAKKRTKAILSTLHRIGDNDEDLFDAVSSQLKNTDAEGEEDAIKKSYQVLSREEREERMMFKYHLFDKAFLQRIGALPKALGKSREGP